MGEVWHARSAQDLWQALRWLPVDAAPAAARTPSSGSAVCSLVLGLLGLIVLIGSLGFLFVIALPLSVTAWALGRQARRSGACGAPGVAIAGEVIGSRARAHLFARRLAQRCSPSCARGRGCPNAASASSGVGLRKKPGFTQSNASV